MTSSAGTSGLINAGSPPIAAIASRIAARSTTAGTPVKSCMTTRAGVKAISLEGAAVGSHEASASMSAASTDPLPSVRSRFSSRIFSENGRRATSKRDASASRRKMSTVRAPTESVLRASKLFVDKRFSGGRYWVCAAPVIPARAWDESMSVAAPAPTSHARHG